MGLAKAPGSRDYQIDWGEFAPTTRRLQTPMIPAKRPRDGPQPRDMEGGDRPRRTGAPPILLSGPRRKAPLSWV